MARRIRHEGRIEIETIDDPGWWAVVRYYNRTPNIDRGAVGWYFVAMYRDRSDVYGSKGFRNDLGAPSSHLRSLLFRGEFDRAILRLLAEYPEAAAVFKNPGGTNRG